MTGKKIVSRVLAAVLGFLLLWFSAGLIDYISVICLYREPVFCIKNADENGGFYHGLGYSYVIVGNFGEEDTEELYGAKYIEFEVFGKRVRALNRY